MDAEGKVSTGRKREIDILKGILTCKCGAKMSVRAYVKNDTLFSYYYCDETRPSRGKVIVIPTMSAPI